VFQSAPGAKKIGRSALVALLLLTPVIAQIQNQPDDGQWIMPAKNYASTRSRAGMKPLR
jgi:hypothetical protein